MQLKADQLTHHLESQLLPIYLISGDEPFLIQEAMSKIRDTALASGFSERRLFDGSDDSFEHLSAGMETMSLFAERSIYEFRSDKALSVKASQMVAEWCAQQSHDDMVLISMPRLTGAAKQKAWLKALEKLGAHVTIFAINSRDFPDWLAGRAARQGISLSGTALAILVERTEGNLLAANQEIERLALLHTGDQAIDEEMLKSFTADNARFGHFELIDTCLSGHSAKAVRMLHSLQQEGVSLMELTGALNAEIRKLCRMTWQKEQGESLAQIYKSYRVWYAKQAVYNKALNRYPGKVWYQILNRCLALDKMIKGQLAGDAWLTLEGLLLVISGQRQFSKGLPKAS